MRHKIISHFEKPKKLLNDREKTRKIEIGNFNHKYLTFIDFDLI